MRKSQNPAQQAAKGDELRAYKFTSNTYTGAVSSLDEVRHKVKRFFKDESGIESKERYAALWLKGREIACRAGSQGWSPVPCTPSRNAVMDERNSVVIPRKLQPQQRIIQGI